MSKIGLLRGEISADNDRGLVRSPGFVNGFLHVALDLVNGSGFQAVFRPE